MTRAADLGLMAYGSYPDLSGVRRVLVVLLRHLGDTLLAGPVCGTLAQDLDAKVDVLVYGDCASILRGHPGVHDVLVLDKKWKKLPPLQRWARELALIREVRARGYDLAVNLTEGDRGAIVAWLSGARVRACVDPGDAGFIGKRLLYTHPVPRVRTPRHTVERHLDVLRGIGLFPEPEQRRLAMHVSAEAEQKARALLGGLQPGKFIVLHPASRWRFKCWPMPRVINACNALAKDGWKIVLTTAPDPVELEMARQVEAGVTPGALLNLAGKTGVGELAAIIRMSRLLLTVDSLPLHVASAVGAPTVALFGPSNPENWGPWMNPRSRVVGMDFSCRPCGRDGCAGSKVSDCLVQLPEAAVLAAVRELLAA